MSVRCLGFALLVWIPAVLHGSSNERDTKLLFTTLDKCGKMPLVSHGVFEQIGQYVLKYQCIDSYRQEGPDLVVCYSNGTWSEIPTCRDNSCFVNTTEYEDLEKVGIKFITNGETETLQCEDKWAFANFALVECIDGKPKISKCCNRAQISTGLCWQRGLMTD
ncbi:beta-2-glycoprotein 1-like [Leuresthes tenuis]|uniref:beta-2-glycoprotein 1-like n=1 Tax=Leuresthes tenuis TaxID=355514 RepID=UPI003B50976E